MMVDTGSPRSDALVPRDDDIIEEIDDDVLDDDVLVLPWWQHPFNILTLFVSIALVAGMVGWLVGDTQSRPSGSEVDIGFLHDMREHHEQALTMSFIYLDLDDTSPGLRTVARSIVFGQGVEIGRMIQMLRDIDAPEVNEGETSMTWMGMSSAVGSMPGMASREQLDELAASNGTDADEIFVELMVAHHLGGVDMARYAMDNGDHSEVRAMAASIVSQQQDEIIELQQLLD